MTYKSVFIFLAGSLVGGSGVALYEHYFAKDRALGVEEKTDDPESCDVCEDGDRSSSDNAWTEADRKRVSEFLQNSEHLEASDFAAPDEVSTAKLEASSIVSGVISKDAEQDRDIREIKASIQIMQEELDGLKPNGTFDICESCADEEDDLLKDPDTEEMISNDDQEDRSVIRIDAIDFVKAVSSGKQMRSFIFDPVSHEVHWNFTNEKLSDQEIKTIIGDDIMNDILTESEETGGVIHPVYLYDDWDDVYSKIETGFTNWIYHE